MRILYNLLGNRFSYKFDPAYDTKTFYQRIVVPSDNYEVKLINLFGINKDYESSKGLNEIFPGFKQSVTVDWGDRNRFKVRKPILVNSGKHNTADGEVITHRYSRAGVYLVRIDSVEDLAVVEKDYDYSAITEEDYVCHCDRIKLVTEAIGGTIGPYIPPSESKSSILTRKLNKIFYNEEEMEEDDETEFSRYLTSIKTIEDVDNKLRFEANNEFGRKLRLASNWCLTVDKFKGMVSEIKFKRRIVKVNNDSNGIQNDPYPEYDEMIYDNFFCRWFRSTTNSIESDYNKIENTLYNMFDTKVKVLNLSLVGAFAHSRDFGYVTDGFNPSYLIKKYFFDIDDFDEDIIEDLKRIVGSIGYLFWDTALTDKSMVLNSFKDNLDFLNIFSEYSNHDCISGAFGLLPRANTQSRAFNFDMLLTNTTDSVINIRPKNKTLININYLCFGSNVAIEFVYDFKNYEIFKLLNDDYNELQITANGSFAFTKGITYGPDYPYKRVVNNYREGASFALLPIYPYSDFNSSSKVLFILNANSLFFGSQDVLKFNENLYSLGDAFNSKDIPIAIFSATGDLAKPSDDRTYKQYEISMSKMFGGMNTVDLTYPSKERKGKYIAIDIIDRHDNRRTYKVIDDDVQRVVKEFYNDMFRPRYNEPNTIVKIVEGDGFKLFLDTYYSKERESTGHSDFSYEISYNRTFAYTDLQLMPSKDNEGASKINHFMVKSVGYKHLEILNSLSKGKGFTLGDMLCSLDINGICLSSDYDTKEMIIDSFVKTDKLYEVTDSKISKYLKDISISDLNQLKFYRPLIKHGGRAFANDVNTILKHNITKVDRLDIRNRARIRKEYIKDKSIYRENVVGLQVNELMFTNINFMPKEAIIDEMFANNFGLEIKYYYPANTVFRLTTYKKILTMERLFMIDDRLRIDRDIESGFAYSEFKGMYEGIESKSISMIKNESKYGAIFDYLRVIDLDRFISYNSNRYGRYASEDLGDMYFSGLLFNRIVPTHCIQMASMYNVTKRVSKAFVVDNTVLDENESIVPLIHDDYDLSTYNRINSRLGAVGVLSTLEFLTTVNFDGIDMDLTPGYIFSYIYQDYEENASGMNTKPLTYRLKDISDLVFIKSKISNLGTNYTDDPEIVKVINNCMSKYTADKKIRYIINVDTETIDSGDLTADRFSEFNSKDVEVFKPNTFGNGILESRTYVAKGSEYIDNYNVFTNGNETSGNAYLTSMYPSTVENINSLIPSTINRFGLFDGLKVNWLSGISQYKVNKLIKARPNVRVDIFTNNTKSRFVPYKHMFDRLYYKEFLEEESNRTICMLYTMSSSVKWIESNDLCFTSLFENIGSIGFTGRNFRYIIGYGILHYNYIPRSIGENYNAKLGKIKHIDNFFHETNKYPNLKSIRGSLSNRANIYNFDEVVVTDKIYLHNIFGSDDYESRDPLLNVEVDSTFLSYISCINYNWSDDRRKASAISAKNIFNNVIPSIKDFNLGGFLSDNIFSEFKNLFNKFYQLCNQPSNPNLNIMDLDEFWFNDIDINYAMIKDQKNSHINDLESNEFSNLLPAPLLIGGNRVKRIVFKYNRLRDDLTNDTDINLKLKNFFVRRNDPNIRYCADPFLFKFENFNYGKTKVKLDTLAICGAENYNMTNRLLVALNKNIYPFLEVKDLDNSTVEYDQEEMYIYLVKVVFNLNSETSLNLDNIRDIIYQYNKSYGINIESFKLNVNCTNVEYTVLKTNNESGQPFETKVINVGETPRSTSIKVSNKSNGRYDQIITNIKFTRDPNQDSFSAEAKKRFAIIDFKVAVPKTVYLKNQSWFRSRIYVKDNDNQIFEMQRFRIKRKPLEDIKNKESGYWHMNITCGDPSRNGADGVVEYERAYKGELLVTRSLENIEYRLESSYFVNNSIQVDIPLDLEYTELYIIADTPISFANSEGDVMSIDGRLGYIFKILTPSNNGGIVHLDRILKDLCPDVTHIDYINEDFFSQFKGKDFNSVNDFYKEDFKITFGPYTFNHFDFSTIAFDTLHFSGIVDSFNGSGKMNFTGKLISRSKNFVIKNSFNGTTGPVGYSALYKPFEQLSIKEIDNSFRLKNDSINKFIPSYFLDSNRLNKEFKIVNSFVNVKCSSRLVNRNNYSALKFINSDPNRYVFKGSFFGAIPESVFKIYTEFYCLQYMFNWNYEGVLIDRNQVGNQFTNNYYYTNSEVKGDLERIKQYISNEYYNLNEINNMNLNFSSINTHLNLSDRKTN